MLPKLEGQITIDTAWQMHIAETGGGTATVTVAAAGTYYWTDAGLLATIAAALTADGTLAGAYTLTLDDDTDTSQGRVTLTCSGGGVSAIALTYPAGSPDPAATLGLEAQGGALALTGSSAAQYLWLPNCGRSMLQAPDGDNGIEESDTTMAISPDGHIYSLYYASRYIDDLAFGTLVSSKVWAIHETVPNESLQSFWRQVIRHGRPFRYHPHRETDTTHVAWRADIDGMQRFSPVRLIPTWDNIRALHSWQTKVRLAI